MVQQEVKLAAKSVNMRLILDEFRWGVDAYGKMRCPHPAHKDSISSAFYDEERNACRCFVCDRTFDTIDAYRYLSDKAGGRVISFPKAVEEVTRLEGVQNIGTGGNTGQTKLVACPPKANAHASGLDPYAVTLANSKLFTGYELAYLHGRGILIYDSYVYGGEVKTAQKIEKELLEADAQEKARLNKFKEEGIFFKGIAPILRENKITILHNYYNSENHIIYNIVYDGFNDEELFSSCFFDETSRRMAVQKGISGGMKRVLGDADFIFITRGLDSKDIFICEGIEDSLSFTMNGLRSISLNSTSNVRRLTEYLQTYFPRKGERFVLCLDHDDAGMKATEELTRFFGEYNSKRMPKQVKYECGICHFPQECKDINEYWQKKLKLI